MNTEKWRTGNSGLLAEADRSMYKNRDTVSKSIIHPERTHLNYNLCPHKQYTMGEIKAINRKIRGKEIPKNAIAWGGTILTQPKDYTGSTEDFFRTGYDGLKKMYGLRDEDIISAYVHMDESTPHMHFYFIPIAHEQNKDCINWNKVMPRKMYKMQHEILQAYMSEKLQTEVHILNGETLGIDLQRLTAEDKQLSMGLAGKRAEIENANDVFETVQMATAEAEFELTSLREKINAKKNEAESELTSLREKINAKKNEAEEIYKPREEALERLNTAMQRLLEQLSALKPKEREKEKDIFDFLEKHGKVFGKGNTQEITKAAAILEKESARLDADYFSIEDDDDFER